MLSTTAVTVGSCCGEGSCIGVSKRRREVALCSFATKKRASDQLSVSSDGSLGLDDVAVPEAAPRFTRGRGRPRGRPLGSRGRGNTRGRKPLPPTPSHGITTEGMDQGNSKKEPLSLPNEVQAKNPPLHSPEDVSPKGQGMALATNYNTNNRVAGESSRPSVDGYFAQDDDQVSIASSSTNSNNSKTVAFSSRATSRAVRSSVDSVAQKQPFSFESLFSFLGPPKLVVRDGELVPEQSLSLKNVDRHAVPEGHPIFNWSCGQPVKPVAKRRKKSNSQWK